LVLALLHAVDAVAARAGTAVVRGAWWLVAAIALQATLGILTLLNQAPINLALTHQAVAIVVLTLAIFQTERLVARRTAPDALGGLPLQVEIIQPDIERGRTVRNPAR
jgi:cytochrome c oxidase assembly protein subunit 15